LYPNTRYDFYVVNGCASTQGYASKIDTTAVTFAPCAAPTGVTITPTCKGGVVSWTAVSGATNYSTYLTYVDPLTVSHSYGANVTTNSWTISGIPTGSSMSVYVKAKGCNGGAAVSAASETATSSTQTVGCKMDQELFVPTNGNTQNNTVTIFPNPNKGTFELYVNSTNNTNNGIVEISDIMGRSIFTTTLPNNNGVLMGNVNLASVQSGIYLVKVTIGNTTTVTRLSINN
jgi:hypothetical protein